MRITSKGRYGLKAMMELANGHNQGLLKTREIAERQKIPLKYLEQIINTLKKGHLVSSVRGADGGYRLSRAPQEITVFEILQALEGDLSITEKSDDWDTHQGTFWNELDSSIKKMLEITLTDFVAANKQAEESLMYYI